MRKASIARLVIGIGIVLASALLSFAIDTKDTALLTQPAISAKAIAFVLRQRPLDRRPRRPEPEAPDDRHRPGDEPGVLAGRRVSSPSAGSTTATWTSISCRSSGRRSQSG